MFTEGGARGAGRFGAPPPSLLSEDETIRSGEVVRSLYPPRIRRMGLLEGSDSTSEGFGGVARPFLSDEIPLVDDLIWSVE